MGDCVLDCVINCHCKIGLSGVDTEAVMLIRD